MGDHVARTTPVYTTNKAYTFEKQHPYHSTLVSRREFIQGNVCNSLGKNGVKQQEKGISLVSRYGKSARRKEWPAVLEDTDESEERLAIRKTRNTRRKMPTNQRASQESRSTKRRRRSSTAEQTSTMPTEDDAKGQTLRRRIQDLTR